MNLIETFLSSILSISLVATSLAGLTVPAKKGVSVEEVRISNPYIVSDNDMEAGQRVTWDCIWFGSYPQAEVVPAGEKYQSVKEELIEPGDLIYDDTLYQTLQTATKWDSRGNIVINGNKYRRIRKSDAEYTPLEGEDAYYQWQNEKQYHYFKYQPIKWRVLSVSDSNFFLLADKALHIKQYHTAVETVTWETSTLRSWLNGYNGSQNIQNEDYSMVNFINTAFSGSESAAILDTNVKNEDSLWNETEGGNDTVDKIFLLSESEAFTDAATDYGFVSDGHICDEARRAKTSLYAKALGTYGYSENTWWWLRSPQDGPTNARRITAKGNFSANDYDEYNPYDSVRPALNLNVTVSSDKHCFNLWSYAGTVCSDGTVEEVSAEVHEQEFNQYIYRANLLFSGEYPGSKEEYILSDTPSKVMVRELQKSGFGNTATAWKNFTDICDSVLDVGKVIDIAMEEKDIYSATILNAMESAVEKSLANQINTDAMKDSEELFSIIKEGIKLDCNLEIDKETKNSVLTVEMRKRVKELIGESLEKRGWSKAISWLSNIEKAMKYVGTIEDFCKEVSSYINLRNVDDSMKEVLKEMRKICPKENKALQTALNDCIKILDVADNEFAEQLVCGALKFTGREAAKTAISHFWEKILIKKVEEIKPELAIIKLAYKSSKYITNLAFNTDELTEKYLKMAAVVEVGSLMKNTYYSLKSKYQKEKTSYNAETYLRTIDIFFSLFKYDCENAYAYVDELSSANLTQICALFGQDDGNSLKESINNIKSNYGQEHESILVSWVNYLKEDYPNQYPSYSHLIKESMERRIVYKIHCPVDVYIYNSNNTLVASVVNDIPSADELAVMVENDEKTIYVTEGEEYTFQYIGNDKGSMDINITECNQNNAVLRNVYFNDLTLAKGTAYISLENGRLLENKEYRISAEGNNIEPDFDTLFLESKQAYQVKIGQGTIYKNGEPYYDISAYEGEILDISVYVPEGYRFVRWEMTSGKAKIGDIYKEKTTLKIADGDVSIQGIVRQDADVYTLSIHAGSGGKIVTGTNGNYAVGAEINLKAEADTGYDFIGWEAESGSFTDASRAETMFIMPSQNVNIIAKFQIRNQPDFNVNPGIIPFPSAMPSIQPTHTPEATVMPEPVKTPEVTLKPSETPMSTASADTAHNSSLKKLKKGTKIKDKKTSAVYKIVSNGKKRTVEYVKTTKKNASGISIPASVKLQGKTYQVISVGKAAFLNNKKLKSVKMGKNIKQIGSKAFSGCKKLKNVAIGKKVTVIGTDAFSKCTALTLIVIPSNVKKIGTGAFKQCRNLRYIQVNTNKLTAANIGKNAFAGGYGSPRVKTDKHVWKKYSKIFTRKGLSGRVLFIIDPVKLVI